MTTDNNLPDTGYVRIKQVLRFIPVSKSTWWAGVKTGRLSKPVNLGGRVTAWRVQDIRQYIDSFNKQS